MRLVSTSPDNTEILCALGVQDSLVGISKHCDYPVSLQESIPVVSDFAEVYLDKLLAVKPDVVFCATYYQANIVKTLVDHHVRVFVTQPSSLESIAQNIQCIGQLVGQETQSTQLIEWMHNHMPQQPLRRLKVFTEEWGSPIILGAPWIHEMVARAGGTPVLSERIKQTHTNERIVTAQEVLETQADVVILSWCGCHGKIPLNKVLEREGWEQLPAVQKQQVFIVEDSYFVRPGPRLVEGYQQLTQLLSQCQP